MSNFVKDTHVCVVKHDSSIAIINFKFHYLKRKSRVANSYWVFRSRLHTIGEDIRATCARTLWGFKHASALDKPTVKYSRCTPEATFPYEWYMPACASPFSGTTRSNCCSYCIISKSYSISRCFNILQDLKITEMVEGEVVWGPGETVLVLVSDGRVWSWAYLKLNLPNKSSPEWTAPTYVLQLKYQKR